MKSTRIKILEYLQQKQTATTSELGHVIGYTEANIRHHLHILLTEGVIKVAGTRRAHKRGRPAMIYQLDRQAAAVREVVDLLERGEIPSFGPGVGFAFSIEEETGLIGASTIAARTDSDVVFSVDTFVSSASPVDWQRRARVPLGAGPVLKVMDGNHVTPRDAVDRR